MVETEKTEYTIDSVSLRRLHSIRVRPRKEGDTKEEYIIKFESSRILNREEIENALDIVKAMLFNEID